MAHSVRAIYSTRLALFIHGITSAKKMRKVWPVVLVRESSTQLVMYSLDIYMCQILYIYTNFRKAPLSLSPVIENCLCRGRESVSDSISAIEAMWLGLCTLSTHYIDDLLPYEPLCSY